MHMHIWQVCAGVLTAAALAGAAPLRVARAINCTPTDDDGTALTGSSVDAAGDFATCSYKDAGDCTYFFADGSFSSGSSTCPKGLPQNAASSGTESTNSAGSGTGASVSGGSIDSNINCAPVDDDGTPLTASSADSANDFATCEYKDAGECTYFFADGSFSSGSSTCPKGLPQTGGTAATTTAAAQTTTAAPPPPPPATTSPSTPPPAPPQTTSTPPPQTTPATSTSSTETETSTATITSTSTATEAPPSTTAQSTSAPTTDAAAATPVTTPAAPAAPAPSPTDDGDGTTTVFVPPSPALSRPSPTRGWATPAPRPARAQSAARSRLCPSRWCCGRFCEVGFVSALELGFGAWSLEFVLWTVW
ncbi:hypothetical protein B0H17DRAFT_716821 [Mycena rosella]|uniref:Uncharacterized protein n=1 Tax=Mycena rosella TaxID=1033263 RepID=A0AAD7DA13_MYCRO|nr:hypothetical protein B0H17DRAFT_716821 [Mycena rosella]